MYRLFSKEVFSALEEDWMTSKSGILSRGNPHNTSTNTVDARTLEKYIPFSQEIPTKEQFAAHAPPPLPPHMHVVLEDWSNDDHQSSHPEAQANPVLLNHLFLMQISDDVLAQSMTIRTGKKFTTTVFYTPL